MIFSLVRCKHVAKTRALLRGQSQELWSLVFTDILGIMSQKL